MSWEAHKKRGNDAYTAGNLEEALSCYAKALSDDTLGAADRAVILSNRAMVHLKMKNNVLAVDDCTTCLTHQREGPTAVKALFRRCVAGLRRRRPRAQLAHPANRHTAFACTPPQFPPPSTSPPFPPTRPCSGAAYEALGQMKDALRDFRATLQLDPKESLAAAGVKRCEAKLSRRAFTEDEARALVEIQGRRKEVQKQKARVGEQKRAAERERRQAELTLEQLGKLPAERRVFTGLGRMYVLSSVAAEGARMAETAKKNEERARVCVATLASLDAREKSEESAFQEAVTGGK